MSHHIGQTITKQIRKKLYVEKAIFLMRSIFLCILSAGCGNDNITEQAFISKSSDGNTDVGGLIPDLSIDQRYHQKFYGSFAPNLTIFGKQDILGYFPAESTPLLRRPGTDKLRLLRPTCLYQPRRRGNLLHSMTGWLEHIPQEYIDAQLPLDQAQAVIDKTASDEFGLCGLAEITQSKLVTELSLERAESSSESEEVYSETGHIPWVWENFLRTRCGFSGILRHLRFNSLKPHIIEK